ncbi:hypothetical protein AVEN_14752-1 [Araneus ventricosus]|uniref:Uncharacterized protein n=1 Tax=Araneus ventricosus TaxID=182803 RepID=A0A4Y2EX74_ARAVE|nr:hypothetical protein AVEN_195271-1 [Araneus ventricosus]GBM32505.1 hypothetical protein AVEN_14752-1 [Araneus ventricosus]
MRRAAKNDTRGTIFRLITILWSHLHEEKHVGSLIAKNRFGQSRLSAVHQRRYGGWTCSTIGAGRIFVKFTIPSLLARLELSSETVFREDAPWVNELDAFFFKKYIFILESTASG